jgi:hemerythrin-like domain-containing protein
MTTTTDPDRGAAGADTRADAPDLTSYYAVHTAMRRSNESLVRSVGATEPGDTRRVTALAHWFDGYCAELRNHHHNEDGIVFPALRAKHEAFAELDTTLAAEHHRLDQVLDELAETFASWAVAADSSELQARALDLAVELHDLLRTHLDVEDADVLPMIAAAFTAAEYAELDKRVKVHLDLRQAMFTVPWFMASVGPEAAAAALRTAPLALRLVYRATRRRYAKLWHEAFCSCV